MGTHGPGGDLQENKMLLVLTTYGLICGSICLMQPKKKSMPAAVHCRCETCRNIGKHKTKNACIVDATIGRCAAHVSRRSHLCKRNILIEPPQFGT